MCRENKKLESIQVIRAIGFILIFLSHVELVSTGPIGVSLFLVLSGFCMAYSYIDKPERLLEIDLGSNIRFAWSKIKKLYPLHLVTLLSVAIVVFGSLLLRRASAKDIAEQGAYLIANSLLLHSWIPWRDGYYSFNAVSWYLSTIAFIYFLFPWIIKHFQLHGKRHIWRFVAVTVLLMAVAAFILGIGQNAHGWSRELIKWIVYICPLYRLGDFIVGLGIGCWFVSSRTDNEISKYYSVVEVFVILLLIVQVMLYNSGTMSLTSWSLTLFWLPGSAACILVFARNKGLISKTLSSCPPLIWLGNISGEAFLIHQICIKAVEFLTKNKWIVAIISFAVTLVATIIWRWFINICRRKLMKTGCDVV